MANIRSAWLDVQSTELAYRLLGLFVSWLQRGVLSTFILLSPYAHFITLPTETSRVRVIIPKGHSWGSQICIFVSYI